MDFLSHFIDGSILIGEVGGGAYPLATPMVVTSEACSSIKPIKCVAMPCKGNCGHSLY